MIDFHDFIFGTATASHQIEGNNKFNDWWDAEKTNKLEFKSGKACDHWNRYKEDIELMDKLNYDTYRFSLEWSRIFPREGKINKNALERYQEIIDLLNQKDITPMVTLHHFTLPKWFTEKGGFAKDDNLIYWRAYVNTVKEYISNIDFFCTINEPMVYVMGSYMDAEWPPFKSSLIKAGRVEKNLLEAHDIAYNQLEDKTVGIVKHYPYIRPKTKSKRDIKAAKKADNIFNWYFMDAIWSGTLKTPLKSYSVTKTDTDFIGLNYYTLHEASHSWNPFKLFLKTKLGDVGNRKTLMDWSVYPKGIYKGIKNIQDRYDRPIYVTENGIATNDDEWRIEYILKHLKQIHKAREEGYDVRGYMYWSLMDNFEWAEGFEPRFGLLDVNFNTCERTIRESAKVYGKIAEKGGIPEKLIDEYI